MIYTTWSESTVSTSYYIKLKPIRLLTDLDRVSIKYMLFL
jgi:hypothetical protein